VRIDVFWLVWESSEGLLVGGPGRCQLGYQFNHSSFSSVRCSSCYKCYFDESSLIVHMKSHLEAKRVRNYKCDVCGKSYTQVSCVPPSLSSSPCMMEKKLGTCLFISYWLAYHDRVSINAPFHSEPYFYSELG